MSRIGSKPVSIPEGVSVDIKENEIEVKGKNASLSVPILESIKIEKKDGEILFSPEKETKQAKSNWGTMRSLVNNAIKGASENFSKELVVEGIGYRANIEGNELVMGLGYSHSIRFTIPDGLEITVEKNVITIKGADKAQVGEAAAKIRSFKKPEPYKGKGIRYSDEVVKRKTGKKAGGSEGS